MLGILASVTGSDVLVQIFADIWPVISLDDSDWFYFGQNDLQFVVIADSYLPMSEYCLESFAAVPFL